MYDAAPKRLRSSIYRGALMVKVFVWRTGERVGNIDVRGYSSGEQRHGGIDRVGSYLLYGRVEMVED